MKKRNSLVIPVKISLFVLLAFTLFSCDKCKDTDCFTPPMPFYFQLIDKETNQNLLQNGTYVLSDIRIKPTFKNEFYTLKLDSVEIEGEKQVVLLNDEIGWQSGNDYKNYLLFVKDSSVYNFVYHTEQKNNDCCTYYELEEVSSSEIEISKTTSSNGFLYKIAL